MADLTDLAGRLIRVTGLVQGVGFRPFVWRLAHELQMVGWVRNDALGVEIAAQGSTSQLDALLRRLRTDAPVLARVDAVHAHDAPVQAWSDFVIHNSLSGPVATAIGTDVAVCSECLNELLDPSNRRWRHAFITCTHCGPRYTVTHALPYDRAQTSMAAFPLCGVCATEYTTPADRRFHAETTCCPQCGPHLTLLDMQGHVVQGDAIERTVHLLQTGAIVAIKGLGGFHLACDARNADTVARLRRCKNRETKPFAVMVANTKSLAAYATLSDNEHRQLQSRERPIVLLRARAGCEALLPGAAPGLLHIGVMLPTTPIHYLLFHEAADRPWGCDWCHEPQASVWIMTSANPGGEPIVRTLPEALDCLTGIADAVLDHDRGIVAQCDDSVVRVLNTQHTQLQFIRRSRGYAPAALRLPRVFAPVLAFGAHLKNTVCVTRGHEAFLSPHVGDLNNAASCEFQDETVERMVGLHAVQPTIVAHDLHPDDYSTRAAIVFAQRHNLPTLAVQHHHAHIAAVCAEHGWCAPVLGLALDGFGWGTDGTAWGGELLQVDGAQCQRWGHLRPLPMPGGDRAAREPWRMAASVLHEMGRGVEIAARWTEPAAAIVAAMLQRHFNSPLTSSMGRVFDAAAGLLGMCTHQPYEAQAAIVLEQAALCHIEVHGWPEPLRSAWIIDDKNQLDVLPLLAQIDRAGDVNRAAAGFHATLVAGLVDWVMQAMQATGFTTVACGGGCFLNTLLFLELKQQLQRRGIQVLMPGRTSPGDASIALGQAWVAFLS